MPGLEAYFIVSSLLFFTGIIGILVRRNFIFVLMSLEIMLNSINLLLMGASQTLKSVEAQVIILIVLAVAASEVAIGLGIAIYMMRAKGTLSVDDFVELGSGKE